MGFVRTHGVLTHYRVQGPQDGPVLVLINSLGTDNRIWDALVAPLVDRFRIVSYDKRGHGLSDVPAGPYTIEQTTHDIIGLIDHLGIARCTVVGVSVGGLMAQGFALAHAERLDGLVLMNTAARIGDAEAWEARIALVAGEGMAGASEQIVARWFGAAYQRRHAEDFAGWRNMLERTPPTGYAAMCGLLRHTDLTDVIGGIEMPTLVVAGADDISTPPELVRRTAERLARGRFETIPDAGHLPNIEQPEALAGVLKDYFMEIGLV